MLVSIYHSRQTSLSASVSISDSTAKTMAMNAMPVGKFNIKSHNGTGDSWKTKLTPPRVVSTTYETYINHVLHSSTTTVLTATA